jgi:hypothetical protein
MINESGVLPPYTVQPETHRWLSEAKQLHIRQFKNATIHDEYTVRGVASVFKARRIEACRYDYYKTYLAIVQLNPATRSLKATEGFFAIWKPTPRIALTTFL